MLVRTFGSAVYGVDATTITVEVNVTAGLHTFIVGLPDSSVKESIQRIESAIKSNGCFMPRTKLIVNLAPADLRKSGSAFDLPIAIGVLAASEQLSHPGLLEDFVMMGELGLDGSIQPLRGALSIAIQTRLEQFKGLFVPRQNAREAAIVNNLEVYGVSHIHEVIAFFNGGKPPQPLQINTREEFADLSLPMAPPVPWPYSSSGPAAPASSSAPSPAPAASPAAFPAAQASSPASQKLPPASPAPASQTPPRLSPYIHPSSAWSTRPSSGPGAPRDPAFPEPDFAELRGQSGLKRALEVAAAGGHNVLLIGPPGSGKTMAAKRLPSILPPLTLREALETTKIHSVAGKLPTHATLITRRPFRSPHHTISDAALVGGGLIPQPGEISLAHNGVLFLDELPEFRRSVLEVMRQPIEERHILISRTKTVVDFPAAFMLLASMNPCPCGYYNHPGKKCTCVPGSIQKYLNKVSGPILDRIDLHIEVAPPSYAELSANNNEESSATIRERVVAAREIQAARYKEHPGIYCNAQMNEKWLQEICSLSIPATNLLRVAMQRLQLSARAHDRILKTARTIADLAASQNIRPEHLAEAIQYRSLDRESWGA